MKNLCDNCGEEVKKISPDQFNTKDDGDVEFLCIDCQNKNKVAFQFFGLELIKTTAKASGNGSVGYVPKGWIGSRLAIVRLDRGSEFTKPR
jgi:hypothetical protein